MRFAPDGPDPALWSPTPYDGDYAMCLRPLPFKAGRQARSGGRVSDGAERLKALGETPVLVESGPVAEFRSIRPETRML